VKQLKGNLFKTLKTRTQSQSQKHSGQSAKNAYAQPTHPLLLKIFTGFSDIH
jgi:hypothetical protein